MFALSYLLQTSFYHYSLHVKYLTDDPFIDVDNAVDHGKPLHEFVNCTMFEDLYPGDQCMFALRKFLGLWDDTAPLTIEDISNIPSSFAYIPTDESCELTQLMYFVIYYIIYCKYTHCCTSGLGSYASLLAPSTGIVAACVSITKLNTRSVRKFVLKYLIS